MKNTIAFIGSIILSFFLFINGNNANAQINVTYIDTGSIQRFVVPCGASSVNITAAGGQGGGTYGGLGANFTGTISVTPGQVLFIVVGGIGGTSFIGNGNGGGGGSFVYDSATNNILIVAGGGGGGYYYNSSYYGGNGGIDLINNLCQAGGGSAGNGADGTGGNGGAGGNSGTAPGAGGAGWLSNGGNVVGFYGCYGGNDRANGFEGGAGYDYNFDNNGGYGGGGGGAYDAGGGGGGYNGGGGGNDGSGNGGDGGASYLNGSLVGSIAATNTGNGSVIISYTALTVATTVTSNENCIGDSTGKAYVTASYGVPPYSYSWSNGNTTDTISRVTAGTYTISVTDNNGCVARAYATITQPGALLDSAVQFGYITCHGNATGHATAFASGGTTPYTYLWMPSGGTKDTASGLSAGTYTLTVTDPCKDTAITMITITQPASVLVGASQTTDILCFGGSNGQAKAVVIGGWGDYSYLWSNGATTATASGLVAGTYTVHARDSSGCRDSVTVVVVQPAALALHSATTSDVGSCNGTAWLTVTGGTSPYSYFWSDGSITDTITGQCAGTYCCFVTDSHGCQNYDCATIQSSQGVQNVNNTSEIKVYPNPSRGAFTISGLKPGEVIELYNYMGQNLDRQIAGNSNTMQFDISSKSSGVYLIRIETQNGEPISEKQIMKL